MGYNIQMRSSSCKKDCSSGPQDRPLFQEESLAVDLAAAAAGFLL